MLNKQRLEVGKRCGRIEMEAYEPQIAYISARHGRDMRNNDIFSLYIKDMHFKINRYQQQALVNKAFYIIYYNKSNLRIVAMERVDHDC